MARNLSKSAGRRDRSIVGLSIILCHWLTLQSCLRADCSPQTSKTAECDSAVLLCSAMILKPIQIHSQTYFKTLHLFIFSSTQKQNSSWNAEVPREYFHAGLNTPQLRGYDNVVLRMGICSHSFRMCAIMFAFQGSVQSMSAPGCGAIE